MKNHLFYMLIFGLMLCMTTSVVFADEHKGKNFQTLEEIQDEAMLAYQEIYKIVREHPEFSVEYVHDNGKLEKVIVEGIESPEDRRKVELMVFNYEEQKARIRNIPTRTGVYYSAD